MSFRLRAAHSDDIEPLYEMAKLTGGGFTNLPADKGTQPTDHIYLIDPLGNLLMSYPASAPDKALLTDVKKLLRLSHIG